MFFNVFVYLYHPRLHFTWKTQIKTVKTTPSLRKNNDICCLPFQLIKSTFSNIRKLLIGCLRWQDGDALAQTGQVIVFLSPKTGQKFYVIYFKEILIGTLGMCPFRDKLSFDISRINSMGVLDYKYYKKELLKRLFWLRNEAQPFNSLLTSAQPSRQIVKDRICSNFTVISRLSPFER